MQPAPTLLNNETWFRPISGAPAVSRTVKVTSCYLYGSGRPIGEIFDAMRPFKSHWPDVRRVFADWGDCELDEIELSDEDDGTVLLDGDAVGYITTKFRSA
jgi:hypothetical protein